MDKINKKTIGNIDIAKFFFAICIVALHTGADTVFSESVSFYIEKAVFRLAVPFFFVASGFFIGKKIGCNNLDKNELKSNIKKYCFRLIKPLVFFSCVNILLYLASFIYSKTAIKTIILKTVQSVVFYPWGALWYVQACIVGIVFLYPFLKSNKINIALFIGVLLYSFALLCNNYYFLIDGTKIKKYIDLYLHICVSARNGLFTGFLFLGIGIFTSKIYNKLILNKKLLFTIMTLSIIIYFCEITLLRIFGFCADDGALYISHIFLIPLLLVSLSILPCSIDNKKAILMRNLSTGIYFLHRPIYFIVGFVFQSGVIPFIIVLFVSILICLIVYKTKMKFFYGILK